MASLLLLVLVGMSYPALADMDVEAALAAGGGGAAAPQKTGADLQKLIDGAADGATITLKGTYTAPAGTTYVVSRRLNVVGSPATLINIRLIFEADMTLSNVTFIENDCTFHSYAPTACPASTPMISIGLPGYTIGSATISGVSLQYTRAYTGIAFGMCPTGNVTISEFSIVDNEMSGITGLGGNHIVISNGTITGGTQQNVDDGVALYAVYGPLNDVTIEQVTAQDAFDLIGIGALLYYPITNVRVSGSQCTRTAVCLYIKSGDQSPVPAGFTGYSYLNNLSISGITDSDPGGSRYQASIWMVGAGGAAASDISVDHVTASARAAVSPTARIRVFTDAISKFSNVTLSNLSITDPSMTEPGTTEGFLATEGVNFQDLGSKNISGVNLTNVNIDGAAAYAIDSGSAVVSGLSIAGSAFTHMDLNAPGAPLFFIPYPYQLNGSMVTQ